MAAPRSRPIPGAGASPAIPAPGWPAPPTRRRQRATQVAAFCGTARAGRLRRVGEHDRLRRRRTTGAIAASSCTIAQLAQAAGGVDAFLIGSELRGLTTLRDAGDAFPFVEALVRRSPARCAASSGRRRRSPMAPTGASISATIRPTAPATCSSTSIRSGRMPAIDAVGIDNYMPLSDWRDGDYRGGNPDGFAGPYDPAGLRAASPAARVSTGTTRLARPIGAARRARRSPTAPTASPGCSATRI